MSFTCATGDFQKSRKTAILENCTKNLSFENNQMFDVFKMPRPVCIRLYFDLIKYFTPKPFIFKNVVFCIFNQKSRKTKKTFPKTPLDYCPCKCTNLGENSFQYHQLIVRNMRLKSVRL